eukprot:scaffold463_cov135-Skeletonema_menzelii.AAC.5
MTLPLVEIANAAHGRGGDAGLAGYRSSESRDKHDDSIQWDFMMFVPHKYSYISKRVPNDFDKIFSPMPTADRFGMEEARREARASDR